MEIRQRNGYFLIKSNGVSAGLIYAAAPKVRDDLDVFINYKGEGSGSYSVCLSGEYEIKDVFVMVLEKNGANQYLVEIENISILLADSIQSLSEQELDTIGSVDILILKQGYKLDMDLVKFVNKIDPRVLLLENVEGNKESIRKYFGAEIREEAKKLKFKSIDFDADEYKLDIIQISEK